MFIKVALKSHLLKKHVLLLCCYEIASWPPSGSFLKNSSNSPKERHVFPKEKISGARNPRHDHSPLKRLRVEKTWRESLVDSPFERLVLVVFWGLVVFLGFS